MALTDIRKAIADAEAAAGRVPGSVRLIAVSKVQPLERVEAVLEAGHRLFGENRVQEAEAKWPELKARFDGVELHLIGPLQTNKVKQAVRLFDVIETVDREKLAAELAKEMAASGRVLPVFVQVNIGREPQKAGIDPDDVIDFVARCKTHHKLDVIGLMCIPPADQPAGPYFAQLAGLAKAAGVAELSMGMSADFETAIAMGATHVRVGSALFGSRA